MYCKHALCLSKEQFEEQKFKNEEDNDLEQYIFQARGRGRPKIDSRNLKVGENISKTQ